MVRGTVFQAACARLARHRITLPGIGPALISPQFSLGEVGCAAWSKGVILASFPAFLTVAVAVSLRAGSVYASMKALQGSNMETQIVFRSATPIAVSGLEFLFLGRDLPNTKCVARAARGHSAERRAHNADPLATSKCTCAGPHLPSAPFFSRLSSTLPPILVGMASDLFLLWRGCRASSMLAYYSSRKSLALA